MNTYAKRIILRLLVLITVLCPLISGHASGTNPIITAVMTVTNNPTGTNGHFIIFQGVTYRWTNTASPTIGYISATNSSNATATNLFSRLSRDYTNTLRFSYAAANKIQVSTLLNGTITISNSSGWLTNLFTTNAGTADVIPGKIGASNITAVASIGLGGSTITNWNQIGGGSGTTYTNYPGLPVGVVSNGVAGIGTNWSPILDAAAVTNAAGTNSALAAAQALDATVAANANAAIGVLSNLTVTFTITTNLSYTNYVASVMASNNTFNANYVWDTWRYVRSDGTNRFITYSAASNSWIMGSITVPNLPSAFTNDTLTGQYDTNQLQSTAPYVYFPSNAIITTNWFIAGASFKLPLTAIEAEDYGARGDAVKLYAATVASGNLICTNAAFTAEDVGKSVAIYSTATNSAYDLAKIIMFNNPTNVLLSTNFTRSTPYEAWYGTDNRVGISNALNSFTKDGLVNLNGKYGSVYMFASAILDPTNLRYAVINVPTDRSTDLRTNTSRTIVLNGQTPPMVYPAFLNAGGTSTLGTPNNGTILLNFAKPVSGSTNVFVYHDGTGAGGSQFARERFVMNNLTLRQPGQPTHHGVFLKRGGTTYLRNFAIDVDQSPNWLNATSGVPPFYMQGIVSNANTVYGIYGPDPYNYAGVTLENVTVSYHGTAYRFGEHTMGIGKVTGVACGALYESDGAFGSQGTWNGGTFPFLYAYLCQYRIVIATNSTFREPLVIGNLTVEEGYPRADIGPLVYDPYKRGDINIGAITGNGQNTTIESTNGTWNDTILKYSYIRGIIISNGVVYGSGSVVSSASGTNTFMPTGMTNQVGSGYVYSAPPQIKLQDSGGSSTPSVLFTGVGGNSWQMGITRAAGSSVTAAAQSDAYLRTDNTSVLWMSAGATWYARFTPTGITLLPNLNLSGSMAPTNGVILPQLSSSLFPTNLIAAGVSGKTNWTLINYDGVPKWAATNMNGGGFIFYP